MDIKYIIIGSCAGIGGLIALIAIAKAIKPPPPPPPPDEIPIRIVDFELRRI